jgi:hypothetical protein
MLLLKLTLFFVGPFFGLAVSGFFNKINNALNMEDKRPGIDWDMFLFALLFWYALLCATEFLV